MTIPTNPTKEQIRQLREEMGLSRQEFGAVTYVTVRAVTAWEYGERKMGRLYWEKYLEHFAELSKLNDREKGYAMYE